MQIVKRIIKARYSFDWHYFRKVSFRTWVYSAFLTFKYIDEFEVFPAIQFKGRFKVVFKKDPSAVIQVKKRIIFEKWLIEKSTTTFTLKKNSRLTIDNDFVFGDTIRLLLNQNAKLYLKGKKKESASGITAKSIILVNKYLEIGHDCIIAWDTFLTDSDWHSVEGKEHSYPTIIKDHVWIGVGVKILKGVQINDNCIVTSNSVILRGEYKEKSLISGNPAKIVKENISFWNREMNHEF